MDNCLLFGDCFNGQSTATLQPISFEGRCRHQNNSKKVVRNLNEWKVVMKGKSPKQRLTSAKDITIELPEGRESSYNRLH